MEPLGTVHVDVEPGWRGGQIQVFRLVTGLAERGNPVVALVRRDGELARRLRGAGIETVEVPGRNEADPASIGALVRVLRRHRPAVLAAHSGRSHGLAAAAGLLARSPVPLVPTRRVAFRPRSDPFTRWKYRRARAVVAISRAVASALEGWGMPPDRIRVVHSGVEPPSTPAGTREAVRRELGVPDGARLVGSAAALTPEKGHAVLLRAFAAVAAADPRAILVLAGDGPERAGLEAAIPRLGLGGGRVLFLGRRDDVPRLLAALDLFAVPSLEEGLGTAAIEAAMAGLPVVASAAGGLPEIVEDGVTGRLVPPGEPDPLAAAILELLGDPERAGRFGAAGRARALERFSVGAMVEGTLAVYRDVTTGRG